MEWISILDALPEPSIDVLVCYRDGNIDILTYAYNRLGRLCFMYLDEHGYWREKYSPCVLYWMPLPEPPDKLLR